MKLSNTQIKYKIAETGLFTDVADLTSCDVAFTTGPNRSQWEREGSYTSETINSIELNYTRGSNPELDDLGLKSELYLQWYDGAIMYTGKFIVNTKINTRINGETITALSVIPTSDTEFTKEVIGGSGGDVTKTYVDNQDATTLASAKAYTDTKTTNVAYTDKDTNFTQKLTVQSNAVLTSSDAYTKTQSDANYVAKSTSTSGVTAYVRNSGSESNMTVAQVATANSIARRAGNGVLFVGEPTADTHAATKKYVDDNKGTVVSGTDDGTNWTTITIGTNTKSIPSGGSASADVVNFDCEGIYSGVECSGNLSDEDFAKIQKNTTVAKITDASIEEGAYIYSTDRTVVVEDSVTGTEYYVYNFVRPVESDGEVSNVTLIIGSDKVWQATLYNVKGASEGLTDVDKKVFEGNIVYDSTYGWYNMDGTTEEDFKAGETIAGEFVYNAAGDYTDFDDEAITGNITVGTRTFTDVNMINIGDGFTLAYLQDDSGNIALRLVSDGTTAIEVASARLQTFKVTREWQIKKLGGEYIATDGSTIVSKNNELVVDIQTTLAQVEGYDETVAQTLEHDASGALKWVNK